MKQDIYDHFGLTGDPWDRHQQTADSRRVARALGTAVRNGQLLEITGERGTGKSLALWRAIEQQLPDIRVIEPLRLDREGLHIGDIQRAIIEALSQEQPRHSAEARAGQVRRLLRAAAGNCLLVIDEAHLLHHQTVRAIKRLRELGARGSRKALLPVVLVGQRSCTAAVSETGLRTQSLAMGGLTRAEAAEALRSALGRAIDESGAKALSRHPDATNWLTLERLADDALALCMQRGGKRLDGQAAGAVMAGSPVADAAEAPAEGSLARAAAGLRSRKAPQGVGRAAA